MTKLNKEQLKPIIERFWKENKYRCESPDGLSDKKGVTIDNYTLYFVEDFGGEGMGDSAWVIYKLVNNKDLTASYIQYDGYYSSYDGTDWESWNEFSVVEPVDVVITQYHGVKELN